MSKRPSRGVSSGIGSPTKMTGRDGDLTIRKTKEGKILYVKEHGSWHPINTGVDTAKLKKDVDRLIRSVNTLRSDNNPFPTINSLNIRKNVATATVDPKITFTVAGTDIFTMGVNDSVSSPANPFQINNGSTLDDTSKFELDASGNIEAAGNMNIASSKVYKVNGTEILSATALDSAVKINNDNWSGTALEDGNIASSSDWDAAHTHITANGSSHSLLAATAGTLTASKAIVVDASSRVDTIKATSVEAGSGSGVATIKSSGAYNLSLKTGTTTLAEQSSITMVNGADKSINLVPTGTGSIIIGTNAGAAKITSKGAQDLELSTNAGTNSGTITITDGVAGAISLTPNGIGTVNIEGVAGFKHEAEENIGATGGKTVNFCTGGNKRRLRFTAINVDIDNLKLVFPEHVDGNFTFIIKNSEDLTSGFTGCSIGNWQPHVGVDTHPATGNSGDVLWAGGAKPTITTSANAVDIVSFYWDSNEEIAYGVITQDFRT